MRKVYVDELQPGMALGKTVYNERGDVLLAHRVGLTAQYIDALRARGFYAVYVLDGLADEIEPPDIISDRVRIATYKHVRELFDLVHTAALSQSKERQPTVSNDLVRGAKPLLADLYRDVERIVDEVTTVPTITGVVSLKSHDNYTFEHSVEVTVAGVLLGERLNLTPRELRQLALGCLCHDIGKRTIPVEILNKPGRLTAEEFELVRQHPTAGYETMRQITGSDDIVARQIAWQHHERQDGTGYPRGLRGTNGIEYSRSKQFGQGYMMLAAEIAAVADVYCALASDRPYRKALPPAEVADTLKQTAGSHLNHQIVTRFLSMLPTYPVGTEVVAITGAIRGYWGVVTEVNPRDIHRPMVRMLFDPHGAPAGPFEVDTSKERDVQIAPCLQRRCGQPCPSCLPASRGTDQDADNAA